MEEMPSFDMEEMPSFRAGQEFMAIRNRLSFQPPFPPPPKISCEKPSGSFEPKISTKRKPGDFGALYQVYRWLKLKKNNTSTMTCRMYVSVAHTHFGLEKACEALKSAATFALQSRIHKESNEIWLMKNHAKKVKESKLMGIHLCGVVSTNLQHSPLDDIISDQSLTMEYCLIKNLAKENPVGKNSSEGKKSAVYS
ncbi:hypothetical protein LXL04_038802 [Taraxacum kok-saghyz]